ncbi:MAG TPA: DUF411 domain-containing protein [Piscinibacter sp.]|jgi:hypothetical protein|uniref:DUF411 domain-containing protein n=1 Tax=Piscinibacter sp. TaxID=1903157 RepID=UPI002C935961|nr:DUF411 domain-containing protein [Piscinibacter sp.]HNK17401.1 DUF411 domain-containing protein [Piscinibacter sp.]
MNTTQANRRQFALAGLAALALPAGALAQVQAQGQANSVQVEVWKSPSCGCCKDWIAHMEKSGFRFTVHETGNTAVRQRMRIPLALGSCHTAVIGRYAIEGHVPAKDVQRLLREKPEAVGLTVPGMPIGSPGMDGPEYGGRRDAYDVLLVAADGSTRVYSSYR